MADNDEHRQEETYEVTGDGLLGKVKQLIHEGNVRKIILRREDGSNLMEIPLTASLGVTALTVAVAPVLIAVGAIAAVVGRVIVVVERDPQA